MQSARTSGAEVRQHPRGEAPRAEEEGAGPAPGAAVAALARARGGRRGGAGARARGEVTEATCSGATLLLGFYFFEITVKTRRTHSTPPNILMHPKRFPKIPKTLGVSSNRTSSLTARLHFFSYAAQILDPNVPGLSF